MAWDEWEQIKEDVATRHAVSPQLNQLAPVGGGGSGAPDPASSPAKKQAAAKAIKDDLEPAVERDGQHAAESVNAAVKEFGARDGYGWDTSGALKKAHTTWERRSDLAWEACGAPKLGSRRLSFEARDRTAHSFVGTRTGPGPALELREPGAEMRAPGFERSWYPVGKEGGCEILPPLPTPPWPGSHPKIEESDLVAPENPSPALHTPASSRPYAKARRGYGKRTAPDQLPSRADDFALLPERERYIAGYVDRLPEGSAMDVKSLAKSLPLYGQMAVGTALRALGLAGHLRRVRCQVVGDRQSRWGHPHLLVPHRPRQRVVGRLHPGREPPGSPSR